MECIMIDRSLSSINSLAVYISDLEPNKPYEGLKFKIEEQWHDLPCNGGDKTNAVVIADLQPYTKYEIVAQYQLNGQTIDIPSTTFVTYPSREEIGIPALEPSQTVRNAPKTGAVQSPVTVSIPKRGD